jgi:uncharacterized protein
MARRMAKRVRENDGADGSARLRRCIASGDVCDTNAMVRLVLDPEGVVVPDVAAGLPGRGFWLSARRDAVKTACEKNLFAKAARAKAIAPPGLAGEIERQLTRRCLDLLGIARRAGATAVGFEKAKAQIQAGRVGLFIEAADGSVKGRAKMTASAPRVPVIDVLTGAEIGAAVGREYAVHIVVEAGPIADKLLREATRLGGFRTDRPTDVQ